MRNLTQNKKGLGIGDLYLVILTIAIVAILLGVVMFILSEFQDMGSDSFTVYNETTSAKVSEKGITVSNASICGFKDFAVIKAVNKSNGTAEHIFNSSDYSYDVDTGSVFGSGLSGNNSYWNITYSYVKWRTDESCEAVESVTSDFVDFIPWIGIILLVIAAGIILGIVIQSFAGKKQGV